MQELKEYVPISHSCPYWDFVGPFYEKECVGGYHIGVRIEGKHRNLQGVAQGGLIATLADIALGYNVAYAAGRTTPIATINLTTDFAGTAQVGDWLEARVDVQQVGNRVAFANAYIHVGKKRIARASGVFSISKLRSNED
jgi:acyl-coenzyme A thioesterase PaaI-like protein